MNKKNNQKGSLHSFWLTDCIDEIFDNYSSYLNEKEPDLTIHDDLMIYFQDWFSWIKTTNPSGPDQDGFNMYGPSIINLSEQAILLKSICQSFLDLYYTAPEQISLTTSYLNENNEIPKMTLKKEELIDVFKILLEFSEKVIEKKNYILHFGI